MISIMPEVNNLLVILSKNGSVKDVLDTLHNRLVESTEVLVSSIADDFSLFVFVLNDKAKGYPVLEFVRSRMDKLRNWFAIEADNLLSASELYPKMIRMYSSEEGVGHNNRKLRVFSIDNTDINTVYTFKDSICSLEEIIGGFTTAWQEIWGIPTSISDIVISKISEFLRNMRCSDAAIKLR